MKSWMKEINHLFIARTSVPTGLYNYVCDSSAKLGYDLAKRRGGNLFPAVHITYYDSVKFCNALSELLGLVPEYYADGAVFRTGENDALVQKTLGGIRLLKQSEWEDACRGGNSETKFFWGNEPDRAYAWFYAPQEIGKVHNVGEKLPNAFGLYDMSGNVCEWCDWNESEQENSPFKLLKGGSIALDSRLECDHCEFVFPYFNSMETGFRICCETDVEIPEEWFVSVEYDEPYRRIPRTFEELFESGTTLQEVWNHLKNVDLKEEFAFFYTEKYLDDLMSFHAPYPWFTDDPLHEAFSKIENVKVLVAKWIETKDKKYLDKWMEIAYDFALNGKIIFDNLSQEEYADRKSVPNFWFYTQGYDTPRRARGIMAMLGMIAKYSALEELEEEKLKTILAMILSDDLNWNVKDARESIPNQILSGGKTLLMYGRLFTMAKHSGELLKIGTERFKKASLASGYLKDGGALEQSYNYNMGMVKEYLDINVLFSGDMPEGFEEIGAAVVDRVRMLKALMLPIGGHPATGTVYSHYHPALYNDIDGLEEYKREYLERVYPEFGRFPEENFGFTSIAFPYSGYYVLRDGWNADSVYLWLIGSRKGMGHASENINGISLCAYGMNMLINAGADHYDNMTFVLPEQRGIIGQITAYKRSSYGENTVLIDGKSQSRLAQGENNFMEPYRTVIDAGFYTGKQFDFTEGFYKGPYEDLNAVHNRQIIFVKKLKIFIIIDKVEIEGKHKFTGCWHIMPDGVDAREQYGDGWMTCGYKPEEIFAEGNKVYTAKQDAPNFSIHVFGKNPVLSRHYGELDPCLGWLSPCIVGRRYKKTDIHVEWESDGSTKLITVISPYRDEDVIKDIAYGDDLHIYSVDGDEVVLTDESVRINEDILYFSDVKAPQDFRWEKDENGALKPVYSL